MKHAVIITGTSSGLGQALVEALKDTDISLVCISRHITEEQRLLVETHDNIQVHLCNLSFEADTVQCADLLSARVADAEAVTFISNAATVEPIGAIGELDSVAIRDAAHCNFIAPMLIVNALCRDLGDTPLTVINVSSGAARRPIIGWPLYCSTKAAANMFFSVLEEQFKGSAKVTVYEFDPGVMDTQMQERIRESSSEAFPRVEDFRTLKTAGKLATPDAVASKLIEQFLHL